MTLRGKQHLVESLPAGTLCGKPVVVVTTDAKTGVEVVKQTRFTGYYPGRSDLDLDNPPDNICRRCLREARRKAAA